MNPMKTKIIAFGSLLIIAVIAVFFLLIQGEKDIMEGSPKLGRPTEMPAPAQPSMAITDPVYATPTVGAGVVGEEVPSKAVSPENFQKLYIPYVDEYNVPAGSGFALESTEKLTAGASFTAKVYPKGSNASDSKTIEVGKGTVPGTGTLKMNAALPTNLSDGSYTLEVSDGTKVFQTSFVVRPPLH